MYTRVINIISHGNYSLYEPVEMMDENKEIFRKLLGDFRKYFPFNSTLFWRRLGEQGADSDDRTTINNNWARPSGPSRTSCAEP